MAADEDSLPSFPLGVAFGPLDGLVQILLNFIAGLSGDVKVATAIECCDQRRFAPR